MSDMSMSSMMDDINKYAKIWDSALAKGIFNDAPRPPVPAEPEASADFFGQLKTDDYDMFSPLNEGETCAMQVVSCVVVIDDEASAAAA